MIDSHVFEELLMSDPEFAKLLNLSVEEFGRLERSAMYAYINQDGTIEEYFMYIHPDSPVEILKKLHIEKHNFIRFAEEEVKAAMVRLTDKNDEVYV